MLCALYSVYMELINIWNWLYNK